ncbi:hypothetical protein HPB49_008535 [Dermacentor silvarum]|uniref:Uncharacterized protein n=1 Tax=Dermacentor silvarum TaxID=543639 RepID=A0ACB8DNV0_DERSI|nr:hypothetical protein HPB49_008535 [Dermacentor silvarum]
MDVHPVDYAIFCVLTASSLALGLYHSKRGRKKGGITVHTNSASVPEAQQEEVFLGGRSLPTWSLALSMLASGATGVGVVSMSAHQYAYGLHFLWDNVALAMTTPCIVFFVLPVLYRLKVTSVFEGGCAPSWWYPPSGYFLRTLHSVPKMETLLARMAVASVTFRTFDTVDDSFDAPCRGGECHGGTPTRKAALELGLDDAAGGYRCRRTL